MTARAENGALTTCCSSYATSFLTGLPLHRPGFYRLYPHRSCLNHAAQMNHVFPSDPLLTSTPSAELLSLDFYHHMVILLSLASVPMFST